MTHKDMIAKVCNSAPVIPVLTIDRVEDAQPLARALVTGGLPALEITLRTDAAMEAIAAVAEVEGAMAGVGTLLTAAHIRDAKSAGATFGVSPGATEALIQAAQDYDLPLLPGAATATEAILREVRAKTDELTTLDANCVVHSYLNIAGLPCAV